jgi:hypothetical protein
MRGKSRKETHRGLTKIKQILRTAEAVSGRVALPVAMT